VVAKLEGPQFSGGANIAIKCPSHTYEQTVAFYRDTLGLPLIEEEKDGCIFQFGPNRLWIDSVPNLSHPDVWLELETNDTEAAASFLKIHGISRRDEVEQLREDFNGFFISAPNGVIQDGLEYFGAGKPYYDPAKVTVPTLLVHAEWDRDTPAYMAQALFHGCPAIAGARAAVVVAGIPEVPAQPARIDVGGADIDVDRKRDHGNIDVAIVHGEAGKLGDEISGGGLQGSDLAVLGHRSGVVQHECDAEHARAPGGRRRRVEAQDRKAHELHEVGRDRAGATERNGRAGAAAAERTDSVLRGASATAAALRAERARPATRGPWARTR